MGKVARCSLRSPLASLPWVKRSTPRFQLLYEAGAPPQHPVLAILYVLRGAASGYDIFARPQGVSWAPPCRPCSTQSGLLRPTFVFFSSTIMLYQVRFQYGIYVDARDSTEAFQMACRALRENLGSHIASVPSAGRSEGAILLF